MPTFKRVEGEHNLFVDENGKQYNVTDGEMKEIEMLKEIYGARAERRA